MTLKATILTGTSAIALLLTLTDAGFAQSNSSSGFEQSTAILDTSVLFSIGAQEADQALRGAFGWPTFQEGFVEGVYFRFDPDGYARFSPSPRLDEDVFETLCAEASTACIAKKGVFEVGLSPSGQVQIRIDGITPNDSFYVSDRKSELPLPSSILEPLTPRLESLLSGGGELVIKREVEVVQSVSLAGFSAVATYLRWVAQNQSPRVFPRGWPVPAQSQNLQVSGLTQPNQWASPNSGPQIGKTTWDIQQQARKRRIDDFNSSPTSVESTPNPQRPPINNGETFGMLQSSGNDHVGFLQQQVLLLQNSIQQMQNATRLPSPASTLPQISYGNGDIREELTEFGQSFAQQAQGRSLPFSAGGLGVGGDASTGTRQSANQTSIPGSFSQGRPRINANLKLPISQQYQNALLERIEIIERSLTTMRREQAVRLHEIRQEFLTITNQQATKQTLIPAPRSNLNKTALSAPFTNQQDTKRALRLKDLEARLLEQLKIPNLSINSSAKLMSPESEPISFNRQLIEDILGQLEGAKEEQQETTVLELKSEPQKTESDEFVTLNDYISRVLQTKDAKKRE